MKIAEVIENAAQPIVVQPSLVQRKARISKLVQQLAIADAHQAQAGEPTAQELFLARKIFKQQKDLADEVYVKDLQQQSASKAIAAKEVHSVPSSSKRQKRS